MQRRAIVLTRLSVACLAVAGCAGTSSSLSSSSLWRSSPPPGNATFVEIDEIHRGLSGGTLLEFLQRWRPDMLRPRPGSNAVRGEPEVIDVVVNGHYAGAQEVLGDLLVASVASVSRMERAQAFTQYGTILRGSHVLFVTLIR